MIWFADTQKWNLALETDQAGNVITGRKENLINAIRNGSAVRCVTSDEFYAFPAENIAIDSTSTNVAAQTLNHIGFLGSGLKSIFQLKAHLEIAMRSLFRIFALSFSSLTTANRDVSSANNLAFDCNSLGKSLIYIRKSSGPKIDPCGTPARTGVHEEV